MAGADGSVSLPPDRRMEARGTGRPMTSSYEPYEELDTDGLEDGPSWATDTDRNSDAPEDANTFDPNNFDFTFSEDDLLPTQWSNTQYDYSPQSSFGVDHPFNERVYSRTESKERRITIQRAFVVSEPTTPVNERPDSTSETLSKDEIRSHRVSRTLSTLKRKAKPALPTRLGQDEVELVRPSTQNGKSTSPSRIGRNNGSRRDRSRGRVAEPVIEESPVLDGRSTASQFLKGDSAVRTKSQDAKKRRSFRWERGQNQPRVQPEIQPERRPATPVANDTSVAERPATAKRSTFGSKLLNYSSEASHPKTYERPASPRKLDSFPTFAKSVKIPARPIPKSKDDMWATFRSLEGECDKLQTKGIGSKVGAVESALLPFLRNHALDRSCESLHPENLERRCNILAKWWDALLQLAEEWDNQKLPFRERFIIVEGTLGITERPEWRCTPDFAPLSHKSRHPTAQPRASLSEEDAFLIESVYHNVRNKFVEHLQRQVSIVTTLLASRDPTGALANLGGVSCAYAFFFCPGIAAALIRLWRLPTFAIQKICDSTNLGDDTTSQYFPSLMRSLSFSTIRDMKATLDKQPQVPIGFDAVHWKNPQWLEKWCGRKGDLLYVFLKQYHLLLSDFIHDTATPGEIMRAPTVVMIQTQMLAATRSAIQCGNDAKVNGSSSNDPLVSVDNISPDSNALTVPLAPNVAKSLAGRRLLALLKENLADKENGFSTKARRLLAQGARNALKAAVRQTSLFDHNACYNLCDFVEEVLVMLMGAERAQSSDVDEDSDPAFWIEVLDRMLQSGNTLTAMRVFSLIFSIWPGVMVHQSWKHAFCHDFLLRREVFYMHFNHWCPLVRLYFFRLLAWRVARFDGSLNQDDVQILKLLFDRVQEVWSHYKHIANEAQERGLLAPSTAPCNPVPGRRLLIIRTATPSSPSLQSSNSSPVPSPMPSRKSATTSPDESYFSATQLFAKLSSTLEDRKKGSFLQTFSNRLAAAPIAQSRDGMVHETTDDFDDTSEFPNTTPSASSSSRASIYEQRPSLSRLMSPSENKKDATGAETAKRNQAHFKFSLEAVERRTIANMQLTPPRLPLAAQLLLQAQPVFIDDRPASKPSNADRMQARYGGRALAEWTLAVNECQNFFDRRRREGVTSNKHVETPTLGVEAFKKPG